MLELPAGVADALATLLERSMKLQCLVQDGEVQLLGEGDAVVVTPTVRKASAESMRA